MGWGEQIFYAPLIYYGKELLIAALFYCRETTGCGGGTEKLKLVSTEQIPIFAAAIKSAKSAQTGAKGYAGFYADSTLQSTWQA